MHTMVEQAAERLVVSRMAVLQTNVILHGIVAQHELALPTRIKIDVVEGLFLGVPIKWGLGRIKRVTVKHIRIISSWIIA